MRNHNLDGMRGLAALAVIAGHCELHYGGMPAWKLRLIDFPNQPLNTILGRLWYTIFPSDPAVILFFVMSGYVLSQALERQDESPREAFWPYVLKRIFRLIPTGIVAGAFLYALVPMDTKTAIGTMFLFDSDANGPIWSLRVEWVGFLLVFALWAARSLVFAIALICAFVSLVLWNAGSLPHQLPYFYLGPTFVLGYLIPRVPTKIWASKGIIIASIIALFFFDLVFGKLSLITITVETLGAFGVIGYLTVNRVELLHGRVPQFLGAISYPVYLSGTASMILATYLLDATFSGDSAPRAYVFALANETQPYMVPKTAALAAVAIPIAIAIGWIMHKVAEMPGIAFGSTIVNRLFTQQRKAARPDSA